MSCPSGQDPEPVVMGPVIEYTTAQADALQAITAWLDRGEQVFRLFGYAGTGKTTLAKEAVRRCEGEVLLAAYTGKAARVLGRACSAPSSTIHGLIYSPREVTEIVGSERRTRTEWELKDESPLSNARLLIVDEVSMVDEKIGRDLLGFGVQILVLGDPFQLPPVSGNSGFFTRAQPEVMLTEVHRHKDDANLILDLATAIRRTERWWHRPNVRTDEPDIEDLLGYDVIICGTHQTRMALNAEIREHLGYTPDQGPQPGEKLVCDRTDYGVGLLNGAIYTVVSAEEGLDHNGRLTHYRMVLEDDEGQELRVLSPLEDLSARSCVDPRAHRGMGCLMYASAITCHKAQGSQWDSVMVIDESFTFHRNKDRWLYTAVTRAITNVTVVTRPVEEMPEGYWD